MAGQLDAVGAPFLTKSSADGTKTRKHDNMYTVTGGRETEYWVRGTARKNGENRELRLEAVDYRHGFFTRESIHKLHAGKGHGFGHVLTGEIVTEEVRTGYGPDGGAPFFVRHRHVRRSNPAGSSGVTFGPVRSRPKEVLPVQHTILSPKIPVVHGHTLYFPTAAPLLPIQRTDKETTYLATALIDGVQRDRLNGPVNTVLWARVAEKDQQINFFLFPPQLLPAATRRSHHRTPLSCTVGPGRVYVLLLHDWTLPTEAEGVLTPEARLLYSPDALQTWQIRRVTEQVLEDIPWVPQTAALQQNYEIFGWRWTRSMNLIWLTTRLVPIGSDQALFTHAYENRHPNDPTTTDVQLGFRVYLLSGGTMTRIMQTPPAAFWYLQDIVYVGESFGESMLMAKRTYGFDGINFNIEFVVSRDRGVTWSIVAGDGLPPDRKNQFFGNMTVIKPVSQKRRAGKVIMPAYDPAEQAYYVYETRDGGESWKRRGLITRTERFFRVDNMVAGDGGGNFDNIRYVGPIEAPAPYNPAIPDLLEPL